MLCKILLQRPFPASSCFALRRFLWIKCTFDFFFCGFNMQLALNLEPEVKRIGIWPFSRFFEAFHRSGRAWQGSSDSKGRVDTTTATYITFKLRTWLEWVDSVVSVICWWSFGLPSKESSGKIAHRRGTRAQDAICRLKLLQVLHWMISSRRWERLSNKRHLCCYIIEKIDCRPLPKPKGTMYQTGVPLDPNRAAKPSNLTFWNINEIQRLDAFTCDARWTPWLSRWMLSKSRWMLSKNPKEIWQRRNPAEWVEMVWVVTANCCCFFAAWSEFTKQFNNLGDVSSELVATEVKSLAEALEKSQVQTKFRKSSLFRSGSWEVSVDCFVNYCGRFNRIRMKASFFVSKFEASTLADVQALQTLVEEGEPAQKVGMVMQNHVILNVKRVTTKSKKRKLKLIWKRKFIAGLEALRWCTWHCLLQDA